MEQDPHTHDACQLIKCCSKDLMRVFCQTPYHYVSDHYCGQLIQYCIKYLIDLFEYIKQNRSFEDSSQFIECSIKYLIDLLKCIEQHRYSNYFISELIECCMRDLYHLLECMKKYPASFCSEQLIECCIKELTDLLNQMKQHQPYEDPDKLIECCIKELTDLLNQMKNISRHYDICGFIDDCNSLSDLFKHKKHQLFSDYLSGIERVLKDMMKSLRCRANDLYSDYSERNRYSDHPYKSIIRWMVHSIDLLQNLEKYISSKRLDQLFNCSITYFIDLLEHMKQRSSSNNSDPFIKCCIKYMLDALIFMKQHPFLHFQDEYSKWSFKHLISSLEHKKQNLSSEDPDELTTFWIKQLTKSLNPMKQHQSYHDIDRLISDSIRYLKELLDRIELDRIIKESNFKNFGLKWTQGDDKLAMVYYYFDENLPEKYRDMVEKATKDIETAAPGIHFVENKNASNRIRIFQGNISRSDVGMIGDEQTLELASGAIKTDIIHEFMHALGFLHEHQRLDRDLYVHCHSNDDTNYAKSGIIIGTYDPDSIMHYYDVPGQLETKNSSRPDKRECLSNGDIKALNRVYPPAYRPGFYEPKTNSTGSYHCGRHVIEDCDPVLKSINQKGLCGQKEVRQLQCFSCQLYEVRVLTQWYGRKSRLIHCTKTSAEL